MYTVTLIPGDGIGPEVSHAMRRVVDATGVTIEWEVVEVPLEDRYEIVIEATYLTDVPAPVVVIEPPHIQLPPMVPGEVITGELTITNHGLIRAEELGFTPIPDDVFFDWEFLAEVPDSLGAKEQVTIPYRVTALKALDRDYDGGASGGGDVCTYNTGGHAKYEWECVAGLWTSKVVGYTAASSVSGPCPGGGVTGSHLRSTPGAGGGGTVRGGGGTAVECEWCDTEDRPSCEACKDPDCILGSWSCQPDSGQNGSACNSAPGRECLECVDGECKRPPEQCDADTNGRSEVLGSSAAGYLSAIVNTIAGAINIAPLLNLENITIEASGETKIGEECCNDCTVLEPVDYTETSVQGKLGAQVTASSPTKPKVTLGFWRLYRARGELGVGPDGVIGGEGSAKYTEHESACDDNDCDSVTGGLGLSGAVLVKGGGVLAIERLNIACFVGSMSRTRDDCYVAVVGADAFVEGSLKASVGVTATQKLGGTEFCSGRTCKATFGAVTLNAQAKVEVTIPLVAKGSISIPIPPVKLSKGGSLDCAELIN